jgi:hypothetical protein
MVSPHQIRSTFSTNFYTPQTFPILKGISQSDVEIKDEKMATTSAASIIFETKEIEVCSSSASKTYMSWKATSANSHQGQFMRNYMTIQDGFLYDGHGFIGVALGSYFGEIGSRYIFTLDTGITLKVIKVEAKSDRHTYDGCQQRWDKSVIEFVIDLQTNVYGVGGNGLVLNGNFNNHPDFKGKIIKIEKVYL